MNTRDDSTLDDNSLDTYHPGRNPKKIPEGYRSCEELGKNATIFLSDIVGCSADCPYQSQIGGSVSLDADENYVPICHTKGLVELTEEESRR
jgi:hypothetical protein